MRIAHARELIENFTPFYRDSCNLIEEAKILWGLHKQCDFILELYGIIVSTNEVRLVVDYMVHGNVSDFFLRIKGKAAPEHIRKLKVRIAMQVSDNTKYCIARSGAPIYYETKLELIRQNQFRLTDDDMFHYGYEIITASKIQRAGYAVDLIGLKTPIFDGLQVGRG